jgi:tetratricopeptide (TPR) repeat protein
MSILADLLSKEGEGAPEASKGIPPTLTRAHDRSGQARKREKGRYFVIAALSLVTIVLGFGMTFLYGRLERRNSEQTALNASAVTQLAPALPPAPPLPQLPPVTVPPAPVVTAATAAPQGTPRPAPEAAARPEEKGKANPPAELHPAQYVGPEGDRPRTGTVPLQHVGRAAQTAPQRRPVAQQIAPQRDAVARQASPVLRQAGQVPARTETATPSKTDSVAIGAQLYAARSAEQAGDWRSALASYNRALEMDPGNYKIMSNAAAALNNLGLYREGAQQAAKALERKPNYVPALINAAIAFSSQGSTKEALRMFSAACTADPGNASLAVNLGILQERSGKLDDALATYGKLAASGEPHALEGMGRIYERRGNKNEAAAAYRQILTSRNLNPTFKKEVKDRLMRLED